jgi:hypothetical protein
MVGLLGQVINSSQGLYLHRQHNTERQETNIHALSGIRTHDPSNQPAKIHASDRTATVTGVRSFHFSNSRQTVDNTVATVNNYPDVSDFKVTTKHELLKNLKEKVVSWK